jgi:hypothetical protein
MVSQIVTMALHVRLAPASQAESAQTRHLRDAASPGRATLPGSPGHRVSSAPTELTDAMQRPRLVLLQFVRGI